MDYTKNCLSFWYPLVKDLVPTPKTEIIETECQLLAFDDGIIPEGWEIFKEQIKQAIEKIGGLPVFIRSGQTSAKFDWERSCYLDNFDKLAQHIFSIVEFSECVSIMGLPYNVWAVRELLPVKPAFYAFSGMPITQEFRFFVRDGLIEHRQPYWLPKSFEQAEMPESKWWKPLTEISILTPETDKLLSEMTELIGKSIGGYWSVDWLKTDKGWYMTDMATGDDSFKWYPKESK